MLSGMDKSTRDWEWAQRALAQTIRRALLMAAAELTLMARELKS